MVVRRGSQSSVAARYRDCGLGVVIALAFVFFLNYEQGALKGEKGVDASPSQVGSAARVQEEKAWPLKVGSEKPKLKRVRGDRSTPAGGGTHEEEQHQDLAGVHRDRQPDPAAAEEDRARDREKEQPSPAAAEERVRPAEDVEEVRQAAQAISDEEARLLIVANGGDKEIDQVIYVHFHASGGKTFCEWSKKASYDPNSGIKLDGMQKTTSVCNQVDPDPGSRWLQEKLYTCEDLRRYNSQHGGSNWQFFETSLDVPPPCEKTSFVGVMRHPWLRYESTQGKLGWMFKNATALIRRMKEGDDVLKGNDWYYCPVMHAPTCNGIFQKGYLNNWHIRFLLGTRKGRQIPWDKVTTEHLEEAKRILEKFDLVVPIDFMADALSPLQCAVGARYNLGIDGTAGGKFNWPTHRKKFDVIRAKCGYKDTRDWHDQDKLDLCLEYQKHNELDVQLYDWVVQRWQNWNAGRCRQS